jgi:hypothetical protein
MEDRMIIEPKNFYTEIPMPRSMHEIFRQIMHHVNWFFLKEDIRHFIQNASFHITEGMSPTNKRVREIWKQLVRGMQ